MPLLPEDYIFFITDFETTGVDPQKDFPIEIGVSITDCEFNKVDEFETMIMWPDLTAEIEVGAIWPQKYKEAEKFHKISAFDYLSKAWTAPTVASQLLKKADTYRGKKLILVSDNIQFEYQFMKRLMDTTEDRVRVGNNNYRDREWKFTNFPWHYCGWDSSLFLESTGIGDPPKDQKKHRALADAEQLREYLQRAYKQVQSWRTR